MFVGTYVPAICPFISRSEHARMSDEEKLSDPYRDSAVGKFFEVVKREGNNFKVKCKLCLPAYKIFSCAMNSNANLKKHVQVRTAFASYH